MKVIQYPHYLFSVRSGSDAAQDENGNWIVSGTANVFLSKCREETNGGGQELQVADGTYRKFSSLIQLPKGELSIEEGTSVFVSDYADGSSIRIKGTVLKVDKGQLHSRLWV